MMLNSYKAQTTSSTTTTTVYIYVPSVNYTEASHEGDRGLPTHHMVAESDRKRVEQGHSVGRGGLWQYKNNNA